MPQSSNEGKAFTADMVSAMDDHEILSRIVDVGPGCGTYERLLRPRVKPACSFIGIEIWQPYVEKYELWRHYDRMIVGDVREVDIPPCDLVILGDVLEHMPKHDAVSVWRRAQRMASLAVILSIPIVHYPQGPEEGNPHEAHVTDNWTEDSVMETFAGIHEAETGDEIGVFVSWINGLPEWRTEGLVSL